MKLVEPPQICGKSRNYKEVARNRNFHVFLGGGALLGSLYLRSNPTTNLRVNEKSMCFNFLRLFGLYKIKAVLLLLDL